MFYLIFILIILSILFNFEISVKDLFSASSNIFSTRLSSPYFWVLEIHLFSKSVLFLNIKSEALSNWIILKLCLASLRRSISGDNSYSKLIELLFLLELNIFKSK